VVLIHDIGNRLAGLPNPAFLVFDGLVRLAPGDLLTLMIDAMVSVITRLNLGQTSQIAKLIEQGMAVLFFLGAGFLLGAALALLGRRRPARIPLIGVLGAWVLLAPVAAALVWLGFPPAGPLVTILYEILIFGLWGWLLGKWIQLTVLPAAAEVEPLARRRFLRLVGVGSFTLLVTAAGVRLLTGDEEIPVTGGEGGLGNGQDANTDPATTSGPAKSPSNRELEARIQPAAGTRGELTPNDDFYRIDINTIPPQVDGDTWRLELAGLVDTPLNLSLEEIRQRESVTQAITLECISNRLGGDLISTSLWTGVRLKDILAEAGLKEGVAEIYIESVDGFYESLPLSEAMDERTLLVYAMNGEPLPVEHGFPLRIYIPDHFGMKQPKWITRMEAIDHEGPGFWVERGWSATAVPPTTSVIDTISVEEGSSPDGVIPVGGIAFAGARGISKVEVMVDDGPWQTAELRTPPLSPLTWVQWRFDWPGSPGFHKFSVRATDGSGALQEAAESEPHPNGSTGIHSEPVNVPGD
jgi:DMSO/TMAO reductase YedYZ molybdopterin-dependent catalytic subunit